MYFHAKCNLHVYLNNWGNYNTLKIMYEMLLSDEIPGEINLSKNMKSFVLDELGTVYYQLGSVEKAIDLYTQALIITREIKYRSREGDQLGKLGRAFLRLGEPIKAIEYYKQALEIAEEIEKREYRKYERGEANNLTKCRRGKANRLGKLGMAYRHIGKTKEALKNCIHALNIFQEIGYRLGEGNQKGNIGLINSDRGEYEIAICYCTQALKIAEETGYKRGEGNNLKNLGKAYSDLGDSKKAIKCYKKGLSIGKAIEDPRIIEFCEQKLKELQGFND